jgi:hypothetical protein
LSNTANNPFDPKRLGLPDEFTQERLASNPTKLKKRRQQFAQLPMAWYERLKGADGQTCRVAWFLLHEDWRTNGKTISGKPVKVPNGMLEMDGVPPTTKRRALRDLERRGCVTVERWPKKSPIVRLLP